MTTERTLGVAANVAYDIVPGFTVTAEVDYVNEGRRRPRRRQLDRRPDKKSDASAASLRFQRSF